MNSLSDPQEHLEGFNNIFRTTFMLPKGAHNTSFPKCFLKLCDRNSLARMTVISINQTYALNITVPLKNSWDLTEKFIYRSKAKMADPTDSDTDDSGSVKSGISVSSLRSSKSFLLWSNI